MVSYFRVHFRTLRVHRRNFVRSLYFPSFLLRLSRSNWLQSCRPQRVIASTAAADVVAVVVTDGVVAVDWRKWPGGKWRDLITLFFFFES